MVTRISSLHKFRTTHNSCTLQSPTPRSKNIQTCQTSFGDGLYSSAESLKNKPLPQVHHIFDGGRIGAPELQNHLKERMKLKTVDVMVDVTRVARWVARRVARRVARSVARRVGDPNRSIRRMQILQ